MSTTTLDSTAVADIRGRFDGDVLEEGDAGYDDARKLFNAMIDRKPRLIVRCTGAADVVAGIALARETQLPLAIKSGGHGVNGHAVCDGGIVLDLSPMKEITVDPDARDGASAGRRELGRVRRGDTPHGLVTTGGRITTTGIAGLHSAPAAAGSSGCTGTRPTTSSRPMSSLRTAASSTRPRTRTRTSSGGCAAAAATSASSSTSSTGCTSCRSWSTAACCSGRSTVPARSFARTARSWRTLPTRSAARPRSSRLRPRRSCRRSCKGSMPSASSPPSSSTPSAGRRRSGRFASSGAGRRRGRADAVHGDPAAARPTQPARASSTTGRPSS